MARRDIEPGEQITFDYAMRNFSIEHFPSPCLCGAASCRGTITGWKDLPPDRKAAYQGLIAPYLLDLERHTGPGEPDWVISPPGDVDEQGPLRTTAARTAACAAPQPSTSTAG